MPSPIFDEITANYDLLKDVYFDDMLDLGGGVHGVTSSTFKDIGWNYIFRANQSAALTSKTVERIRRIYTDVEPFCVFEADAPFLSETGPLAAQGEFSVWMSCQNGQLRSVSSSFDAQSHAPCSQDIIDAAVSCFREAYCNNLENEIGYNDLEESYPQGFKKMLLEGSNCHLLTLQDGGDVVALGSIAISDDKELAGLYNVAVRPTHRKKGLGKAISEAATKFAFEAGAKKCILQTESHTPVQEMYGSLGYTVDFHLGYSELSK